MLSPTLSVMVVQADRHALADVRWFLRTGRARRGFCGIRRAARPAV
ncbi:hypothetical protein ACPPVO_24065 [Dactylosporangium sp. McL0621]